jgi:hypothetical protein
MWILRNSLLALKVEIPDPTSYMDLQLAQYESLQRCHLDLNEAKALARQLLEFSPPQEVPTFSADYFFKYSLILFQRGHLGPLVQFWANKRKQIEN